jgi:hypothetical protein
MEMEKGSEISFRAHGALLTCALDVEPELGYKYVHVYGIILHHRDAIRPNFEARCVRTSATGFEPVVAGLLWFG